MPLPAAAAETKAPVDPCQKHAVQGVLQGPKKLPMPF